MCDTFLQCSGKNTLKKKIIYYVKEIKILSRFWKDEDVHANDCDFLNVVWNFFEGEKHFKNENNLVKERNITT